jgi:hypothetical protein
MLQVGRSRVRLLMRSLDFSIDLTLPAALCHWVSIHPLTEMTDFLQNMEASTSPLPDTGIALLFYLHVITDVSFKSCNFYMLLYFIAESG